MSCALFDHSYSWYFNNTYIRHANLHMLYNQMFSGPTCPPDQVRIGGGVFPVIKESDYLANVSIAPASPPRYYVFTMWATLSNSRQLQPGERMVAQR
jgi:hypothetical protein